MILRAVIAFVALVSVRSQADSTWVDVVSEDSGEDEVEKRYTSELVSELSSARDDVLLLYTEFSARAGAELKIFFKTIGSLTNDTIGEARADSTPEPCRAAFMAQVLRVEKNALRAGSFSSENHHKFFLGHMIVFRMHLNKSEDYLKKCDRALLTCSGCDTTPRVTRWRRLAAEELNRVRDDLQHSRKSYKDLLIHSHRKLNHIRKQASIRSREALDKLQECVRGG